MIVTKLFQKDNKSKTIRTFGQLEQVDQVRLWFMSRSDQAGFNILGEWLQKNKVVQLILHNNFQINNKCLFNTYIDF